MDEPIAILWELLQNPRDVIHVKNNQSYLLSEGCRVFDAGFFRINNKEAHGMDPQQRILLETTYEALEAAGWPLEQIEGSSTAVYVGAMTADYNDLQMRDPEILHAYAATGLARSMLANRISYFFDLRGPSVTIDTACSSSLVALHHAVQGLRAGDADSAIVAGTALLLDPGTYIAESKLHMLSPDARSRMWDHKANGRARGEGCAAVLLKPLIQALRDHDDIECVIRETCVGSDGRTNGITMPSASAQKHLIQQTYKRAGLDLVRDRCQYFECHGTGTLAGDPVEAQAIQEAFFSGDLNDGDRNSPMYCGSIKTVIGHLEGCAGLAGILKASLAIQNGVVPPNMHFEKIHPAVEPYYDHLCVPTSLIPWPATHGEVRRASVNSFGFGGTNAHAILESPPADLPSKENSIDDTEKLIYPFVFSAKSRSSLVASLRRMATHISHNPKLDLDALGWTLLDRRTAHSLRISIQAPDRNSLICALENQLRIADGNPGTAFGIRVPTADPGRRQKLLGVFTGQGAQWAAMGRELVVHCPLFRATLERCERALGALPDGPPWSLMSELAAESGNSRISQAEISQPLLTALQIALVDLLQASGVDFDAVVGHSSGEIGAAYAVGILTARDAIGIAYYRGLVVKELSLGSKNKQGAMMAVGISLQNAETFCSQSQFAGTVTVAASNAPSTVTLSGDLDAIHEAKAIFDGEGVFTRLLKVDTAYHSHHMLPCEEAYTRYLEAMDIKPQAQRKGSVWLSSVQGHEGHNERDFETLKARYWVENMVRTVMFSQVLQATVAKCGAFAAAIEVGPHPALQNPVGQTLKALDNMTIPYQGCLQRGQSDIESLSSALGMLWCHIVPCPVNFEGWRNAFHRRARPRVLKGLPSYAWDHDTAYWHESRISSELRLGTTHSHELLGRLNQNSASEMTWRNVFRQGDIPWLCGHRFQGEVVFPGAGYVSMAVQAAQQFVRGRSFKTLELHDVNIAKALVVGEDGATVETIFTVRSRRNPLDAPNDSVLEADFACQSCIDGRKLDKNCEGRLLIHLGESMAGEHLQWSPCDDELPPLDVERFHAVLASLGITYSGPFRAFKSINRIWGVAQATASWEAGELDPNYSLNPAVLDVAFQTAFATFSSIADKSMATTFLPAGLRRAVIVPNQRFVGAAGHTEVGIDAHLVHCSSNAADIDINVFDPTLSTVGIQIDGLMLHAISEPQASDDRLIFAKTMWAPDVTCGFPGPSPAPTSSNELQRIECAERTALFFLHNLEREIRPEEIARLKWHHQALLRGIKVLLDPVRQGRHGLLKKEWLGDSWDDIQDITRHFPDSVEIALLKAVGEKLPSVLRDESELLEHMLEDDLLGRLYSEGRGFAACNEYVANFMHTISHKYPRLNILEIGAGTGGTTSKVLDTIGDAHATYTYTDISAGFFEKAALKFGDRNRNMTFKTLNIESSPADQGFAPASLEEVDLRRIGPETNLLSLVELDGAIFATPLSSAKLEILQELLGNVSKVLWVTCGGLTNDPYQSMMTGIGRSLSHELPHVQMQFLDFDEPSSWDMNTVSNYFLRLIFLALPQFKDPEYKHIWTQEPEIEPRTIRPLIPLNTTAIWRFSHVEGNNILTFLPKGCMNRRFEPDMITGDSEDIASALELTRSASFDFVPSITSIYDLCSIDMEEDRLTNVIQWHRERPLSVIIPPTDGMNIFQPDRTYLLVGMTGELGQSLSRFMVSRGARHIVLASRNPQTGQKWIGNLRKSGVDICTVRMDVTDPQQVHNTVTTIRKTMPKVAGVANAAFVLEDSLFVNATIESVERQLGAKVDGTIHLDKEFAQDPLDFFVLFSSLGTVYGNPGQAVYHATNMFMTTFAARRQARGQAASVINIGMISDVGYVAKSERANTHIERHLRSRFYTPLSESEFHNMFVQAIQRGRTGSLDEQLTMGIEQFVDDPDAKERPPWYSNPRFSHMVIPPAPRGGAAPQSGTSQSWRQRLEQADSEIEAADAFQNLFCKKLESMTQTPAASIDVASPLSDLGLDSLLAVEIRTWLLAEVGVEAPLLGILGGESILSITPKVVQRYAREGVEVLETGSLREPSPSAAPVEESQPDANELYSEVWQSQIKASGDEISPKDEALYYSKSNIDSVPTPSETTSPSERSVSTSMTTEAPTIRSQEESLLPSLRDLDYGSARQGSGVYTDTARASFAQIGLHFLDTFLDTSTTFNVTAQYAIEGPLNVGRFSRALDKTLSQHDAYRTCFFTEPGTAELRQGLLPSVNGAVFTHLNSTNRDLVQDIFGELSEYQWDLENGHTFRAIIVTHTPESHSLLVGCHHIIMDGVSWHILLRDLDRAYRMSPLDKPPSSYLDFSREQVEALQGGSWEESTTYWQQQLDPLPGVLPLLPLARQRHRLPQRAYKSHIVQRELSPSVAEGIKLAGRSCRATPMHFYLAVIQTVFANMLELTDMCIGIAHTGRPERHQSDTIGHFTNLLPMRFRIDREASFAELLSATSGVVLDGLSHADVPFDHILERLGMHRSVSHTPLFQVAFNYRVGDLLQRDLGNCSLTLARYNDAKVTYDVTFTVTQTSDGGQLLEVGCNAYLYSQAATESIAGAYVDLLQSLAADQSRKLKNCLPRQDVLAERECPPGVNTHVQDPWPETLTGRFQQVCASFPGSVALSDASSSLTYHQLACRVGQIAAALVCETGVKRGARVAVLCEPSVDMYAALLGVLHVGGIYFPLDPSLPMARIHSMTDACSPSLLLFHGSTAERARQIGNHIPTLDVSFLQESRSSHEIPQPVAEDEAFLLFTSGSTGVPKGIRLTQSGMMNYAAGKKNALALGPGLKVLQQSSAGFDMSIAQVVNAFANGGTLVVAPARCRGDPVAIANLMAREHVSFTVCTPSEYLLLATHAADALQRCAAWRHACSGGEVLTDGVISAFQRLGLASLTLTDCYGPSEVSCAVTLRSELVSKPIQEASVGRPISNTAVYILDEHGQALPAGYPGEICVGGRGVARGYLDEEQSAAKFLRDPFVAADTVDRGFGVMYRTGDKGCLRQDGSLVFLGRVSGDTMVKLRGFRVELDEVAVALLQAARGGLSDAVVGVRGNPQFLVAYVVKSRDHDLKQFELDRLCADLPLPRYMIPSVIMQVERLPTTLNGKVDRNALEDIALSGPSLESADSEEPSLTMAEGELRLLWLDVLGEAAGASRIVAGTDFFMVGGSSLLLVRLQNALSEKMGVRIPLHELYQNSTLRSMAVAASEQRGRVVADTVDWTGETSIPAHIVDEIPQDAVSPAPRGAERHVLLTGATGFLGSEILKALLADASVAMVHCVAVPADKQHNISSAARVKIYNGSLTSPTLGLSQLELSQLQPLIDQIIHAGSQGHCLNNYSTVRTANYISTQFLTRLALPRRVPLHFVSSPRVILLSQSVESPPASMAAHPPPRDGSQGFTASKWASECFLEAVSRRARDLPVVVHRPCSVVGSLAPADDALNAVVRYSRLGRRVPDVPGAEGFFDFRDAAEVAAEIVGGPVYPSTPEGDMAGTAGRTQCLLSFRHYSSGVKVPFCDLGSRMEALYGGSFETVPMAEWIDTAARLGIESVIVSYLKANMAGTARLTFPYMGAS
ncbi:hypothetical protein INS49_007108 [Diaporthe citri]|uniref:uncharacterized protein n=1 Tax=Diaporthe citri TaxID=83186 RepID=UPI001C7EEE99|nr:uncharacterized protein INS49_007108 [Diaporthe citri]KAG6365497.1 hypothetical protein INS49_007108 [Diaporthe citri]